jgi:hypothetical protein
MNSLLGDVLELTSIKDQKCLQGVVETFGNLSEDENFHSNLIHFIDKNQFFHQLLKIVDTEMRREVARFAANVAYSKSAHTFLLEAGIIPYFSCLCSLQDALSRLYSVIGLFNLALELREDLLVMHVNAILSPLADIIEDGMQFDVLSCRYAVLALGALSINPAFHDMLMCSTKNASLIGKLIDAKDTETSMYCCFALSKFSSNEKNMLLMDGCLIGALLRLIDVANDRNICTQCVSALRKLSLKPMNRRTLVDESGLSTLNALSCIGDQDILCKIVACFFNVSQTRELISVLIGCQVIHSIKIILTKPDVESLKMAVGTLANMQTWRKFVQLMRY